MSSGFCGSKGTLLVIYEFDFGILRAITINDGPVFKQSDVV